MQVLHRAPLLLSGATNMKKVNRKVPCEIYSRIVGYFRPVSQWNKGKQEEFRERNYYDTNELFKKEGDRDGSEE